MGFGDTATIPNRLDNATSRKGLSAHQAAFTNSLIGGLASQVILGSFKPPLFLAIIFFIILGFWNK